MKKILLFILLGTCTFLASRQTVHTSTDWNDFVFWEGESWKPHFTDRQTLASVYGISKQSASQPEKAAGKFLQRHHRLLGIDKISNLRFSHRKNSDLGSHFFYQQYFEHLPVEGAIVAIHMNRSNQIIGSNSSFYPELKKAKGTAQSEEVARLSALRILGNRTKMSAGTLVILPLAGEAKPAWKLQIDSIELNQGSMLVYIDAFQPNMILRLLKTHVAGTGEGRIYLENPVVTPDRSVQQFLYLNGNKLNGKFLKTLNANDQYDVNEFRFSDFTTASNPNLKYNFGERDLRLSEAMAYFHINRVHDQWKKVGMTVLDGKAPVFVNVTQEDHGKGLDNAFYSRSELFPNTGVYVFGSGDRLENLSLDADVYYHEYGHGVLDQSRPQLLEAFESNYPRSFHEGFGDVSAAAITGNSKIGEYGLRIKETQKFVGRNLENNNRFPHDVIHPGLKRTEIHHAGLIIGGVWWDLQKTIGAETAQQILFKALPLLPKEMTFFDVRDSILVADSVLNQNLHQDAIENSFEEHGISGPDKGHTGQLRVTALKTALYQADTVKLTPKGTFNRGDVVAVLAEYEAEGVTPGYNMFPEFVEISGPAASQFLGIWLADEALKGRHGEASGALQLLLMTDFVSMKGKHKVIMRFRLGGTSRVGVKRTVTFTMN